MGKQVYNNKGFSLLETIGVLFIISVIIIILSYNPVKIFDKYKERLAVNEIVSDIYKVQTRSLVSDKSNYIHFFEESNKYIVYCDSIREDRYINADGLSGTGDRDLKFRYNRGNVNIANTILVKFKNSTYEIIIHLETGYITVNEK
ncbi:prepilin-type N-terminal cleavage/methylation domain-containing protein [Gemella sp. GH3]|uniref:prepilin-type N-terminal cleavage/methylation domain-containing protein n=1 Tax=unclassified Gemella TaxID=2624949 RepID=UPI0015D04F26|nr:MULTISPECIES: prepilin-type N-terminal cleavage/methylation domain-containing protein [unclassified Gemella]MBF0713232.1 prepilin-type N-terminal cleavage/methylation domain-containing protein [Gemella sp. GH3.1]NYS50184.1 prepilin-type N-terminal cleavage/methylation domain-containing protein [Gemella sp. GH3]